jgi:hypothetical protein
MGGLVDAEGCWGLLAFVYNGVDAGLYADECGWLRASDSKECLICMRMLHARGSMSVRLKYQQS